MLHHLDLKSACRTSAFVDRADDSWRQQPMPRVIRHAVAVRPSRKGGNKVQRASAVKSRGILVCGFARRPPAASAGALPLAFSSEINSLSRSVSDRPGDLCRIVAEESSSSNRVVLQVVENKDAL